VIVEGIVSTRGKSGILNIAPMGARLVQDFHRFRLRPFPTSTTYQNLLEIGEGVFHITDDVVQIAKGAIGETIDSSTREARRVNGCVLLNSCRYYEFKILEQEESTGPASFLVETVETGHFRDFLGFNRAKHAVIEAAILATRLHILPIESIQSDFAKLRIIVEKTAGPDEFEAFSLLDVYLQKQLREKDGKIGRTEA